MKVLVACERSGRVRDALIRRGHDAISCDVEPSDSPGPHICGRVEEALEDGWDMVIGFPPCTFLANIGLPCILQQCAHKGHDSDHYGRWRRAEMIRAALLFHAILAAPTPRIAVENPQPHRFALALLGEPAAVSQPYHHGDPIRKRTLWWLRGLAPLIPTRMVRPTHRWIGGQSKRRVSLPAVVERGGTPELSALRSLTPLGLAEAIADQWGHEAPQTLL